MLHENRSFSLLLDSEVFYLQHSECLPLELGEGSLSSRSGALELGDFLGYFLLKFLFLKEGL